MSMNGVKFHFGVKELGYLLTLAIGLTSGWMFIEYKTEANAQNIQEMAPIVRSDHEKVILMEKDIQQMTEDIDEIQIDQKKMTNNQNEMTKDQAEIKFMVQDVLNQLERMGQ